MRWAYFYGGKISLVFGAETLVLQDLQPNRSPGRKRAGLHGLCQAAVVHEREPPNRVDTQRPRSGRLHQELLVPLALHWPPQALRRIPFAGRWLAISGSTVRRTTRSRSIQFGHCGRARHAQIESPLPVENDLGARILTPVRGGVPPLPAKHAPTVSDP